MSLRLLSCTAVLAAGCASVSTSPAITDDHPASPNASTAYTPPSNAFADAAMPSAVEPPHDHAAPASGVVYTCPHHPEVKQAEPGTCPKCKMKLRPAEGQTAAPHHHGAHK